MATEYDREALELSTAWDRLVAGDGGDETAIDTSLRQTLQLLSNAEEPAAMSANMQATIWANVIAGTAELWRPGADIARASAAQTAVADDLWSPSALSDRLSRYAWIVAAGFIGGFIAGVGSRLFMRVAGILTPDQNRSRLTENGEQVGEITLGGTLSLGLLGAGAGIVTILIYLAIRNRLPFEGWRRSSSFAVLLLLVFGYVIMDPSNLDYQLFGPTWLNVSTFSSLYLLMGFCCAQTYELGIGRGAMLARARRHVALQIPLVLISFAVCAFGALVSLVALFVGAPGLIVVGVAGIAWLVNRFLIQDRLASWRMPALIRPWGTLVVPGIVGFILTARGITEILLNR